MTTKKTDKTEEAPVSFGDNRKIAGESLKPVDRETASHQYQANSPAVDTNVLSDHPSKELGGSILDKIETPENIKAREDAAELAIESREALYGYGDDIDCSKRDVSDPLYCTPGSERHKSFLKGKK